MREIMSRNGELPFGMENGFIEIELRARYKMVRKSKDPHYYLINKSDMNESMDQIKTSREWIKQMGN